MPKEFGMEQSEVNLTTEQLGTGSGHDSLGEPISKNPTSETSVKSSLQNSSPAIAVLENPSQNKILSISVVPTADSFTQQDLAQAINSGSLGRYKVDQYQTTPEGHLEVKVIDDESGDAKWVSSKSVETQAKVPDSRLLHTPEELEKIRKAQEELRQNFNSPEEQAKQRQFEQRVNAGPLIDPRTGKPFIDPETGKPYVDRHGRPLMAIGGGADGDTDEEEVVDDTENVAELVRAGYNEDEARREVARMRVQYRMSVGRLSAAQQGERQATRELLSKRVEDLTPTDMNRLLMVQESAERSAISMMHKISIWLREDEQRLKIQLGDQIRRENPTLSPLELQRIVDSIPLDHRRFVKIREKAEEVVRLIEQNPELEFRSGALQELYGAIENGASEYPELIYEIQNMIQSRSMDRAATLAARYKGGKEFGPALAGYLPEYHNAFYLPGVQAMAKLIEESTDDKYKAETIGQYYRGLVWTCDFDENGVEVPNSRRLLKTDANEYLAGGNAAYELKEDDLQAALKIRLVRMASKIDKKDLRPDIVRANSGGFLTIDDEITGKKGNKEIMSTISDAALAYAFTEIQKSTDGGGGKFILRAEDIADRLMTIGTDKDGNPNTYIGVKEAEGRFSGMHLQITPDQRLEFIKAVNFAQRAYDIAHQKAVITGVTVDAQGPRLNKKGIARKGIKNTINGVEYSVLALPDHVWLTVPNRMDLVQIFKSTSSQITSLNARIKAVNDRNDLTATEKQAKVKNLNARIKQIQDLQARSVLPPNATDEEKAAREKQMAQELFKGSSGIKIDLRDVSKLSESQALVLDQMRGGTGYLLSSAWNLAFRDYFHNHMDEIDVDGSRIRDKVREVGGLIWLNVYLSQNTNRNPGSAAELRKDTFLGAVTPIRAIGRDSIGDTIDKWGDNYSVVARHESDRLTGAAAIKSSFYEGEHKLLSNWGAIIEPEKFVGTFKEHMREYMDKDELTATTDSWYKSLMEFDMNDLKKYDYSDNFSMEEAYATISRLVATKQIKKKVAEDIKEKQYGPWLWRTFNFHQKKSDWQQAIWEFITGYFKQTAGQALPTK